MFSFPCPEYDNKLLGISTDTSLMSKGGKPIMGMVMKPGPKTKDSLIVDNPNLFKKGGKPTNDDLRQLKIRQVVVAATMKSKELEIKQLRRERDSYKEEKESEEEKPDDVKSAYEMLQDMRWVYKNLKGKTKLRDLCKADDKQFLFMIKELMKIESSLKQAEIRKEGTGSGDGRAVFVILKGLDAQKVVVRENSIDSIDMEQLKRVLDPNDISYRPNSSVTANEPPALILKKEEIIQ